MFKLIKTCKICLEEKSYHDFPYRGLTCSLCKTKERITRSHKGTYEELQKKIEIAIVGYKNKKSLKINRLVYRDRKEYLKDYNKRPYVIEKRKTYANTYYKTEKGKKAARQSEKKYILKLKSDPKKWRIKLAKIYLHRETGLPLKILPEEMIVLRAQHIALMRVIKSRKEALYG